MTTFGPLTNLALAFHYDYRVKDIGAANLLGGQYTGVGNVMNEHSAEANFHFDPQAAHIIIHVSIYLKDRTFKITYTSRQSSVFYRSIGSLAYKLPRNNHLLTSTRGL